MGKDQPIASQAIGACLQCGAVVRYKNRRGYLMTKEVMELHQRILRTLCDIDLDSDFEMYLFESYGECLRLIKFKLRQLDGE